MVEPRVDPYERRSLIYYLTDKGEAFIDRVLRRFNKLITDEMGIDAQGVHGVFLMRKGCKKLKTGTVNRYLASFRTIL